MSKRQMKPYKLPPMSSHGGKFHSEFIYESRESEGGRGTTYFIFHTEMRDFKLHMIRGGVSKMTEIGTQYETREPLGTFRTLKEARVYAIDYLTKEWEKRNDQAKNAR